MSLLATASKADVPRLSLRGPQVACDVRGISQEGGGVEGTKSRTLNACKKRKRTLSLLSVILGALVHSSRDTLVSISKKKKSRLCLFYIFLAKIRRYHLGVTGKKKEMTSGVNENDERIGSVSLPWFVKISSDRKFTVTRDRVVGKERKRERKKKCVRKREKELCV